MGTLNLEAAIVEAPHAAQADGPVTSGRVLVQRISRATLNRHLVRTAVRLVALLASDGLGYFLARTTVRLLRDHAVAGGALASVLQNTTPLGFLRGWEYASALLVGLVLTGSYSRGDKWRGPIRLLAGISLGTGLALWQNLWVDGLWIAGLQFVVTVVGVWAALGVGRGLLGVLKARTFSVLAPRERALFVGNTADPNVLGMPGRLAAGDMEALGWLHLGADVPRPDLPGVTDIWEVLYRERPDTVVLCGQLPDGQFEQVVSASIAGGCRVLAVPRYDGLTSLHPRVVRQRGLAMVELSVPTLRAQQLMLKRALDLFGSAVGLMLLSPVFLVIAAFIKLDSPGPVFFAQQRVGFGARPFRMLKFRTMRDGADAEKADVAHLNHTGDARLFKIPNDPRVTRAGAFLRRWSMDELPQLVNVLLGDMSLVGPRPFFEQDLDTYLEHHFIRLGAKPGITGLWQVRGRSTVVDFEDVVRLDTEYVQGWNLWADIRILALTMPAVLRRTGAF